MRTKLTDNYGEEIEKELQIVDFLHAQSVFGQWIMINFS